MDAIPGVIAKRAILGIAAVVVVAVLQPGGAAGQIVGATMSRPFAACPTLEQFEMLFDHVNHRANANGAQLEKSGVCWTIPSGARVQVIDTYGKQFHPLTTRDWDNARKGKGDPALVEVEIGGTMRRGVTWLIALIPDE